MTINSQRIVSLLPSATEILFALGLGDHVLGISHSCDYPPATKEKEVLVQAAFDHETMSAEAIDRIVSDLARRGESIYIVNDEAVKRKQPDLIVTQTL